MELEVLKIDGSKANKKIKLNDAVFAIEPNDHAIYLDVKQILANRRQGTHKTKERGEVAGSTRKIKRQKGTGTARAGDIKNPLFVGGGRIFGPRPRNYSFKLNKKVKKLARKSALSYKAKEKGIIVLEDFTLDAPKTKQVVEILNNLKIFGKKTLIVTNEADKNVYLSSRNLQGVKTLRASDINTYDVLNHQNIVVTESGIKTIESLLA
ncbi:MAG: 50S ribosomal protein L4 [Bacteroidetes bacterium]|nr:MAG: 50S ribosomal protein L4 [Bacteroidota bacterium]